MLPSLRETSSPRRSRLSYGDHAFLLRLFPKPGSGGLGIGMHELDLQAAVLGTLRLRESMDLGG